MSNVDENRQWKSQWCPVLPINVPPPGGAIIGNREGEEVCRRTGPRGERAAIFSSALKRFAECLRWLQRLPFS